MKLLLAICLFAASLLYGQDAKIMIIDRSDTAQLKSAFQEFKKSQKAWEEKKLEIAKKYTLESGKVMSGWESVDFSVDFRAVVPRSSALYTGGIKWGTTYPLTTTVPGVSQYNASGITLAGGATDTSELRVDLPAGVREDIETKEPHGWDSLEVSDLPTPAGVSGIMTQIPLSKGGLIKGPAKK